MYIYADAIREIGIAYVTKDPRPSLNHDHK